MNYLLISSLNSQIQIINLLDEEEMIKYTGHVNSGHLVDNCFVNNIDIETENTYLVSGSEDGKLCYWDVQESDAKCVRLEGISDENEKENIIVNCISSNNNGLIACSSYPRGHNSVLFYKYDFNADNYMN
jgi:WD40 repeat protein